MPNNEQAQPEETILEGNPAESVLLPAGSFLEDAPVPTEQKPQGVQPEPTPPVPSRQKRDNTPPREQKPRNNQQEVLPQQDNNAAGIFANEPPAPEEIFGGEIQPENQRQEDKKEQPDLQEAVGAILGGAAPEPKITGDTATFSRLRGGGTLVQINPEQGEAEAYVVRRTAHGIKKIRVSAKNVERLSSRVLDTQPLKATRKLSGWELQRIQEPQGTGGGIGGGDMENAGMQLLEMFKPFLEQLLEKLLNRENKPEQEAKPEEQAANINTGKQDGPEAGQLAQQSGPVTVKLQPGTRFRVDEQTDTIEVVS